MKRWKVTLRAGLYGHPMGQEDPIYFRFRWMARLRCWVWLNLNLFPGRIAAEIEDTRK